MPAITDRRTYYFVTFLLIGFLAIGGWLRFYQIDAESMSLDEVYSVRLSENSIPGILTGIKADAHPPLYFILLHFWIDYFGNESYKVRSFSVFWGLLSILLVYRVAFLISGHVAGLWSSGLFALSPFFIQYSQQTRGYTLFLSLVLLSYYFFIKIMSEKEGKRRDQLFYVIFTIAMLYVHIYGIFMFISQCVYLLVQAVRREESLGKWLIPLVINSVAYLAWLPVLFYQAFKARPHFSPVLEPDRYALFTTVYSYGGSWPIIILLLLLIILGLWTMRGKISGHHFLLGTWLLIPVVIPLIISIVKPMYLPRYTIGAAAAFYILAALGFSKFKPRWTAPVVVAVLIVLYIPVMKDYYNKTQKEDWRSIVRYIEESNMPGDVIIAIPAKSVLPVRYYYRGDAPTLAVNPYQYKYVVDLRSWGVTDEMTIPASQEGFVRDLVKDKRRVWLLIRNEALGSQMDELLKRALGTSPEIEKRFHGGRVYLFNTNAS